MTSLFVLQRYVGHCTMLYVCDSLMICTQAEYTRVFKDLKGEHIDLCLPDASVPDVGLTDFTLCQGT